SASTVINAIPVGASFGSQRSLTPASRSPARASAAKASLPIAPTIRTSAPSRAAATAWFAPFPPGPREHVAPVTVSPARGSRAARTTRSRLIEPTTVSLGADTHASLDSRRGSRALGRGRRTPPHEGRDGRDVAAARRRGGDQGRRGQSRPRGAGEA